MFQLRCHLYGTFFFAQSFLAGAKSPDKKFFRNVSAEKHSPSEDRWSGTTGMKKSSIKFGYNEKSIIFVLRKPLKHNNYDRKIKKYEKKFHKIWL